MSFSLLLHGKEVASYIKINFIQFPKNPIIVLPHICVNKRITAQCIKITAELWNKSMDFLMRHIIWKEGNYRYIAGIHFRIVHFLKYTHVYQRDLNVHYTFGVFTMQYGPFIMISIFMFLESNLKQKINVWATQK